MRVRAWRSGRRPGPSWKSLRVSGGTVFEFFSFFQWNSSLSKFETRKESIGFESYSPKKVRVSAINATFTSFSVQSETYRETRASLDEFISRSHFYFENDMFQNIFKSCIGVFHYCYRILFSLFLTLHQRNGSVDFRTVGPLSKLLNTSHAFHSISIQQPKQMLPYQGQINLASAPISGTTITCPRRVSEEKCHDSGTS